MHWAAYWAYNSVTNGKLHRPAETQPELPPYSRADMGLYDRDYQRADYDDREPGYHIGAPTTLTTKLLIVTCGVYVAQFLTGQWLTEAGALKADWYRRPWELYQLLTYGFLHSPADLWHIVLNMFALWLFGREVEGRYGRREFLAFYLVAIVAAGIVWTVAEVPTGSFGAMMGASGGVAAVIVLFAMNFPYRTILFMFVIPMPMWVFAVIIIIMDAFGAVSRSGNVAYTAHLGGAAFGFLYYKWGRRFERWLPDPSRLPDFRRRPKLRVLDPDSVDQDDTDRRVDEILQKIQEHGQDSLTSRERRILERASREYQKRRQ
jgi:membrane associated rhomboid family serine protease